MLAIGLLAIASPGCASTKVGSRPAVIAAPESGQTVRLVVSFWSEGAGTDAAAEEAFKDLIAGGRREHSAALLLRRVDWGKEGETDYCLSLDELSTDKQRALIRAVRARISRKKRVTISENSKCRFGNPQ